MHLSTPRTVTRFSARRRRSLGTASAMCLAEALEQRRLLSGSYHLTFDDEFNVLDLADKSGTDTGWMVRDYWYNPYHVDLQGNPKELQYYADPAVDNYNPFSVNNGIVTIRAEPTPSGVDADGQPYVSGELTTTKGSPWVPQSQGWSQKYGYFEVRAKLPSGKGLWPAFWLLPENGDWPPEYDVFEVLGHDTDTIYHTSHWENANGDHVSQKYIFNGIDSADGYHVYGFEWTPDTLTWTIDGKFVAQQANRFNGKMYMLLNMTIGGEWPGSPDQTTPWPAEMKIDYVRAYSNDSSIPSVTPQSGYSPSGFVPDGTWGEPVSLAPSADAYVRDGSYAGNNFGSHAQLVVKKGASAGSTREAYLKFDISSLEDVGQVHLRLYVGAASSNQTDASISVYGVSNTSWGEGGINWNNKPATSGSALDTVTVNNKEGGWYQWDISSYVQQQKAQGKNTISLALKSSTETNSIYNFRPKEYGGSTYDPYLLAIAQTGSGGGGGDAIYSEDFNDGSANGLTNRSGSWSVSSNRFVGQNLGGAGTFAIQTINATSSLPDDFDFNAVTRMTNDGWQQSLLIFDYVNNSNFKYAGLYAGIDEWRIGEVVNGVRSVLDSASGSLDVNTDYTVTLKVRGNNVSLVQGGATRVSYTFGSAVNDHPIGFGIENGKVIFDDLLVESASSATLFSEDFDDGSANGLTGRGGSWSVNGSNRYVGEKLGGEGNWAISTINASSTLPTDFDFSAVMWSKDVGGWEHSLMIFDYVDNNNFKYIGLFAGVDEWRIGQVVNGTKTVLDSASQSISVDTDYAVTLRIRGNTASLVYGGVTKVSYTFGSSINDGLLGFGVENGQAVFDDLLVTAV